MDFLRRVAADSFIVSLFTADYDSDKLKASRTARFFDAVLNRVPKPFKKAGGLPPYAARFLKGSKIAGALITASGEDEDESNIYPRGVISAVIPPVKNASCVIKIENDKQKPNVLRWLVNAFPVWAMLAITAAAPVIGNSMPLAAAVAVTFLFVWLSRRFTVDLPGLFILLFITVQIFIGVTSFHFSSSIQIAMITSVFMISFLIIILIRRACRNGFFIQLYLFCVRVAIYHGSNSTVAYR